MDSENTIAREALFEIIENQMRNGTPPDTKQTYERLIAAGYCRDETMKMLAFVLHTELNDMVQAEESFNENRYVAALHALPELSLDEDAE